MPRYQRLSLKAVLELGRELLAHPVELLDDARETTRRWRRSFDTRWSSTAAAGASSSA